MICKLMVSLEYARVVETGDHIRNDREHLSRSSAKQAPCVISELTNEIQRLIIGRQLIKEMPAVTATE